MFTREALLEATKEFLRVVVLAIIPILITSLADNAFDLRLIAVTGAVAGLRFIDKLLHETGKEIDRVTPVTVPDSKLTGGLTRF